VILVPTGVAPHKEIEHDPGAQVRLEMTRLAAADDDRFEVSSFEVDRPGVSYTVDTLEALVAERPGDEFHLLLGADAAAGLAGWHRPERVIELATPAVARREGVPVAEVRAVLRRLGFGGALRVLEMPPFGVSSSLVRERVERGMPIRYLVPDRVAAMIEAESIYRESSDGHS
jgi:nicotinate-nucleotide adenylyltransferase